MESAPTTLSKRSILYYLLSIIYSLRATDNRPHGGLAKFVQGDGATKAAPYKPSHRWCNGNDRRTRMNGATLADSHKFRPHKRALY